MTSCLRARMDGPQFAKGLAIPLEVRRGRDPRLVTVSRKAPAAGGDRLGRIRNQKPAVAPEAHTDLVPAREDDPAGARVDHGDDVAIGTASPRRDDEVVGKVRPAAGSLAQAGAEAARLGIAREVDGRRRRLKCGRNPVRLERRDARPPRTRGDRGEERETERCPRAQCSFFSASLIPARTLSGFFSS